MNLSYSAPAAASVGGTSTSAYLFPQKNNSAQPAAIQIPSGGEFEGQQFIVRGGGYLFVHGSSPTVNITLYGVKGGIPTSSPLSSGSYTAIALLASAQSLTTAATYPWAYEVRLQGDSVSGILQICAATITLNGVDNTVTKGSSGIGLTGVSFITGVTPSGTIPYSNSMGPALTFVPAITFTVSDALNTATLQQNCVEL